MKKSSKSDQKKFLKEEISQEAQRMQYILDYTQLSANAFAKKIGMKRSTRIGHILSGRNGFSWDLTQMITNQFPSFRSEWIRRGQGSKTYTLPGGNAETDPNPLFILEAILNHYNTNLSELSKNCGLKSAQVISNLISNKAKFSKALADRITQFYPELNPLWLRGESHSPMLLENPKIKAESTDKPTPIAADEYAANETIQLKEKISDLQEIIKTKNKLIASLEQQIQLLQKMNNHK